MNREDFLKKIIKQQGYNLKDFAFSIDMPYTTLLSIVNKSVGGASLDNILKICNGLGICVDDLNPYSKNNVLSHAEQNLLAAYRSHKEMQPAINKMLDINNVSHRTYISEIAAYDVDDTPTDDWQPPISETTAD